VKALLDTHVFLWVVTEPERLRTDVLDRISDPATDLFLSAVSAWEIAIKYELGRLTLTEPPEAFVPSRMRLSGAQELPISHADALAAGALPRLHRDPFDRLLVAQARRRDFVLVTGDPLVAQYPVEVLAAT